MSDSKINKKRLTINLSFFDHQNNPTKSSTKSPKNFAPNGVVGLGIVAAMNELDQTLDPFSSANPNRNTVLAVSPRSTPIPIVSVNTGSVSGKFGGAGRVGGSKLEEEMELSEGYTCVISHIGNNLIKKREYFDDDSGDGSESSTSYWVSSGVFSASSPAGHGGDAMAEFWTSDFLSSCHLCKKKLHGLDIFMYRGERAFCSAECRCTQISIDEHKEKCSSGVMKPIEYSVSPCSGPMQFFAGVVAA